MQPPLARIQTSVQVTRMPGQRVPATPVPLIAREIVPETNPVMIVVQTAEIVIVETVEVVVVAEEVEEGLDPALATEDTAMIATDETRVAGGAVTTTETTEAAVADHHRVTEAAAEDQAVQNQGPLVEAVEEEEALAHLRQELLLLRRTLAPNQSHSETS